MNSRLDSALYDIHHIDALASRNQWMNQKHPLVKFVVTFVYITLVVSFPKYDLAGLAGMAVYPIAGFLLADLSVFDCLKRMRMVLPLVLLVGILNPFLDRNMLQFGVFAVRGGVISMVTLILKGVFTLLAAWLLAATTSVERICYALEMLHIPKIMITQFMLMYRYIFMFLAEAGRISQAYSLRAPGQNGLHIKVWGSLIGRMLLRCIDRAQLVYESMLLRGFGNSFAWIGNREKLKGSDFAYLFFWLGLLLLFRFFPVIMILGNLLGRIAG